jgi:ArsR family transcriptional regulator, arsenate/arsenite/antimonite-responsive transcriptional repressor / arsenate reductase (thioredoxin)
MNIELNHSLEARALKHAALADSSRLHIVDLLTLSDLSSTELLAELGMTSNLLAHHLTALEGGGLIHRHRSEGDRRRSYISLREEAFEGLMPGSATKAHRVVFVCTANSARSQLAAALWQTVSTVPAVSAGTHPAESIAEGAVEVARARGLTLPDVSPRAMDGVALEGDFVVTVCDSAREELGDAAAAHWSVPDPVRVGNEAAFEIAFDDIQRRVAELAPRLTAA